MHAILTPELLLAMATTLVASVVRGYSGFGSAMLQGPIFAILYSPPQAVATIAGLGTLASLQLLPSAAKDANWREVMPLTAAAWLTIPFGAYVLLSLDPDVMRRGISGIALALVLVLMSGWRLPVKPGPWAAGGVGAVCGVINGATGVGGPPVVLYLLSGPNRPNTNRANLLAFYTFLNGGTFISLIAHGEVTMETVWRTLALWPVQIASLWLGAWLFHRLNDAAYRRVALGVLAGVGLFGLFYSH